MVARADAALRPSARTPLAGVALAAGLALRLDGLGRSLWFEEPWSTRVKLENLFDLPRRIWGDVHLPFYSLVMFVWVRLVSDGEVSIRLLPLTAGRASIALTYLVASEWTTSRGAGALAATLLALSPVHIWYSQEARHYSLTICLLLVAALAYWRLDRAPRETRWRRTYTIAMACAVASHFFVAAIASAVAVSRDGQRFRIPRSASATATEDPAAAPVAVVLN